MPRVRKAKEKSPAGDAGTGSKLLIDEAKQTQILKEYFPDFTQLSCSCKTCQVSYGNSASVEKPCWYLEPKITALLYQMALLKWVRSDDSQHKVVAITMFSRLIENAPETRPRPSPQFEAQSDIMKLKTIAIDDMQLLLSSFTSGANSSFGFPHAR